GSGHRSAVFSAEPIDHGLEGLANVAAAGRPQERDSRLGRRWDATEQGPSHWHTGGGHQRRDHPDRAGSLEPRPLALGERLDGASRLLLLRALRQTNAPHRCCLRAILLMFSTAATFSPVP